MEDPIVWDSYSAPSGEALRAHNTDTLDLVGITPLPLQLDTGIVKRHLFPSCAVGSIIRLGFRRPGQQS